MIALVLCDIGSSNKDSIRVSEGLVICLRSSRSAFLADEIMRLIGHYKEGQAWDLECNDRVYAVSSTKTLTWKTSGS